MISELILVQDSHIATESQQREFVTKDRKRKFFGKNSLCPKRKQMGNLKQDVNPLWIVNESFYAHYAKLSGVSMPHTDWGIHDGEYYFLSEIRNGRIPLNCCDRLPSLFSKNQSLLTKGVLLDLALLNGDRTYGNLLCDSDEVLWLNDHDKSLWGDGRPVHKDENGKDAKDEYGEYGDMERYNSQTLNSKFEDYLGDYLNARFNVVNQLVFATQPWEAIQAGFRCLALDVSHLETARNQLPVANWLSDELYTRMKKFLSLWWNRLGDFFCSQTDSTELLRILKTRYEKYLVEKSR